MGMKISVKCDYALRAIFDLALLCSTEGAATSATSTEIASRQKIPQKFLSQVLVEMRQTGLVDARRGPDGGYFLIRSPKVLTVGEVVRSIEQPRKGPWQQGDPFFPIWSRLNVVVDQVLDKTTFAELAERWQARQTEYVPDWTI